MDAELTRLQFPEIEDADFSSPAMPISRDGESQYVEVEEVNPDYTETTSNITYKEREQPAYAGSRSQDVIGREEGKNLYRKSSPAYDEAIDGELVFSEDGPVATPPPSSGKAAPLPNDFQLTAHMRAWAAGRFSAVDVDLATMKFISKRRSEGRTSKNWEEDWKGFIISWANNERKNVPAQTSNVWERRKKTLAEEGDLFADVLD